MSMTRCAKLTETYAKRLAAVIAANMRHVLLRIGGIDKKGVWKCEKVEGIEYFFKVLNVNRWTDVTNKMRLCSLALPRLAFAKQKSPTAT